MVRAPLLPVSSAASVSAIAVPCRSCACHAVAWCWLPLLGCDQLVSDPASMMWSLVSTICLWDQEEAYSHEISGLYSPWASGSLSLHSPYQEWASWCKSWPFYSFVAGKLCEVMTRTSNPVALWILTPSVSFVVHLTELLYDQGKLANEDSWLWFYILVFTSFCVLG